MNAFSTDNILANGLTATTISATTISGGTFFGNGSGLTNVSAVVPAGTTMLISTDEVETTGTINNASIKSFTVPVNTYSRIMVESEVGFQSVANTSGTATFNLDYGGVVKRTVLIRFDATGAGDTHSAGYTLKYSEAFTGGGLVKITTTGVANGTWAIESFRVYGVQ